MSFQDYGAGKTFQPKSAPEDPSQAVAAAIFQINTALSAFNRLLNSLGTPKDTLQLRHKLHKTRQRIGELVKSASSQLKKASENAHHGEVSATRKVQDAKLARDFRSALHEFQKAQRLAAEKETMYAPLIPKQVLESSYNAPAQDVSSSKSYEQQALQLESKSQEVALIDNEIAYNEAIIEEREQGIREIQQQITEVNEIFKDLAVLVHDQGIIIDDIGAHIENSHAATAEATSHLREASTTQRSNSSLLCLLLVVFGIVLLIVLVVILA